MIKRLTKNARKPKGFWGKMMINKMNYGHTPLTKWGFEKVKINKDDAILDVGCGGGNAVAILSDIAVNGIVHGIDYSPLSVKSSIKLNRKKVKSGKVIIKQGSVSSLPYNNNLFNLITAIETIYFWENPQEDFKEVYRVLKDNGTFLVICEMVKNPDGTGKHTEIAEFLKLHYFSTEEIIELFKNAGFKNVQASFNEEKGWIAAIGNK